MTRPAKEPSKPVLCPACSFRKGGCAVCNGEGQITAEKWMEIEKNRAGRKPVKEV